MTFQAYLDAIREKTGKAPEEFRALAEQKGLLEPGVKTAQLVDWLTTEFDLGRGHAMALVKSFQMMSGSEPSPAERIDAHFAGVKAKWRESYEALVAVASELGAVSVVPANSYLGLTRHGKKFAIVAATGDRLDVGLKLPAVDASPRLEPAGSWNSMVTHRVRVTDPAQLDDELFGWLREAYAIA